MPIRIDNDVYKWISALKDAHNLPSVSAMLRELILANYPNINEIVAQADEMEAKRAEILTQLTSGRETSA